MLYPSISTNSFLCCKYQASTLSRLMPVVGITADDRRNRANSIRSLLNGKGGSVSSIIPKTGCLRAKKGTYLVAEPESRSNLKALGRSINF
jgi:hypothetical protein